MGNNEWKSRLKKRTTEAMKKSGEIDKESVGKNKLAREAMSTQDIRDSANGLNYFFNGKPRLFSGDTKKTIEYAITGAHAGYKAGKTGSISAGEYGETQFNVEREKRIREYAEANMPEWLKAGEELVYPEKLDLWKKSLESSAKGEVHGFDITNAVEIMKMLDSNVDVKVVVETYKTKGAFGSYVTKLVLEFSKKGPEYMEQFMSAVGVELTPQMKEKLEALKTQNRQYAENELARNRAAKEDKTDELAKASSQLDELSTGNTGKDENQAVQE